MTALRNLPLSTVTLVFGALGIPLAFLRQLCVPALIMALLAIAFHFLGRRLIAKGGAYGPGSIRRSVWGARLAAVAGASAVLMWVLWGTGVLL